MNNCYSLCQQIDAILRHINRRLEVELLSIYPGMSTSDRNDLIAVVHTEFRKEILQHESIQDFTQDNIIPHLITIAQRAKIEIFWEAQRLIKHNTDLCFALDQRHLWIQIHPIPCEEE